MRVFPYKQQMIVLPFSADQAEYLLDTYTKAIRKEEGDIREGEKIEGLYKFNGYVKFRHFKISKKVKHPHNFLPLIKGTIESTSTGCILFVQYHLFFGTLFTMILWSVLTLFTGVYFLFHLSETTIGSIAFGLFFLNYIVSVANFNIQVNDSRRLLEETLDLES
jgi:hypothetical protein